MNVLEIKELSVSFKNEKETIKVLDNVSFSLEKSKTLGIVGESGSGKSLTVLSILNLLPKKAQIDGGEIVFFNNNTSIDLLRLNEKDIRKYRGQNISMIFQEPMTSLNPSLVCGFQVVEALVVHRRLSRKNAKKIVIDLFSEVKLPDPERIFNSYPHEISGGQKQRVMIAMAIALKPSILIADEPTTALDVTVQKTIIELLKQIQEKYKISIIFISHDLGVISQIAHNIIVMYKGGIVENGKSIDVLNTPKHSYTKALLNCRPEINFSKTRLPVLSDFLNKKENNKLLLEQNQKPEEQENQVFIEINNLNKFYYSKNKIFKKTSHQNVIRNLSFKIFRGETLGLVGESGSGKTTIGRIIAQLIEKNSGNIKYNNIELSRLNKKEIKSFRKKIQIIFQDPYSSLNPKMTVGEALMEVAHVHNLYQDKEQRKKAVFNTLKKVKLKEDSFYKYPHEFSGGQRQRIVIARAIIIKPEFIILDESVSALDVSIQAEILNLLNDLKKEYKLTYMFISHDLSVVRYMADRIMVIKNGEMVEIKKADEIYKSPASIYTKKLLDSIPVIKKN